MSWLAELAPGASPAPASVAAEISRRHAGCEAISTLTASRGADGLAALLCETPAVRGIDDRAMAEALLPAMGGVGLAAVQTRFRGPVGPDRRRSAGPAAIALGNLHAAALRGIAASDAPIDAMLAGPPGRLVLEVGLVVDGPRTGYVALRRTPEPPDGPDRHDLALAADAAAAFVGEAGGWLDGVREFIVVFMLEASSATARIRLRRRLGREASSRGG